tara:strand:+ start:1734 stop:2201 length:468 start_codon:yes stop_codon:yes gene_type:complete
MANYNPAGWKNADVGINHTPAYQVSGRPYATGSCMLGKDGFVEIEFPLVTRWFQIINRGPHQLRVAFSHEGLNIANTGSENYYFVVQPSGSGGTGGNLSFGHTPCFEMKVDRLFVSNNSDGATEAGNELFDVVAGLTSIASGKTANNFTGSYEGV